jgi:hypothetical protein
VDTQEVRDKVQVDQQPRMQANPERLLDIIGQASIGKVVIPEFQRSFVWSREDIEELLVSLLQGYFIGTFLMLTVRVDPNFSPILVVDPNGNNRLIFRTIDGTPFHLVEGLEKINPSVDPRRHDDVRLVLDGQQRITSLFYALFEPPIPLKNTRHPYRFYLRLEPTLEGKFEDAVVGVSTADTKRMAKEDELVQNGQAIPFSWMRDPNRFYLWLYQENQFLKSKERERVQFLYFRLTQFMIPVVTLPRETDKDDVVNIFERINRTGRRLTLFELAAARLYVNLEGISLYSLWREFHRNHAKVAEVIRPESLLKVIALWKGKEPKKGTLLDIIGKLDRKDFERLWEDAARFIVEAYNRMTSINGYGAFRNTLIPYTTMLVPLAVLLETIENQKGGMEMYRKLDKWYWASVFTQRYDSAVDTKAYQDVVQVRRWLMGGEPPEWLTNLSIDSIDVDTDEPRSAIYRGLMCLIVLEGAKDFINGQAANLNECQDDHIFPRAKFGKEEKIDSILNRTLISAQSNRIKSDRKPSEYLSLFLRHHGREERLLETLQSHLISREAYKAMKCDDFQAFIKARRQAFIQKIQEKLRD